MRFDGELGDIGVRAGGWLRPFDDVPSYDVTARLRRLTGGAGDVWLDRMLGRGGTQVSLHAAGRGIDPRQADLQALATVVSGSGLRGLVDSGSVQGRLSGGIADVRGRIGATGGLIDFQGQIILGDELRYRIEHGTISRLNLAALLGDTTASALNAAFRLEGRGTGKDSARAGGSMSLGPSFYGSRELTGARADFALSGGTARLDAEASLGGGSVDLTATGRPFQPRPTLHVERFQVRHLDLAHLIPGVHVRSDLSGTGNVRASGRRLDDSELAGRLTLQPSRLDDEPIEGGDLDASLAGGQLTLRLALRAPAGAVTLAGNARPFDSAATWALREGTFRDLELGRLLGVRGLRTRLAGSLRAEATGRKPELARVDADLTLTPSTVNRAAIQSGRIQARLADGRLHLVGRLLGDGDSLTIDASSRPFEHRPPLRLVVQAGSSHLGALVDRDTLDVAGAARLTLEGELGPRDTMRLRGTISAGGRAGGVTLDSLRATVGLAGGMLDLDTLAVRSNVGQLAGAGRLALFGSGTATSNLKLTANLLDLTPVATLLQVKGLGVDSGRVTALLAGPRDHPRVSLGLMASELTIGHRRVGTARASLEGELGADRSIAAGKGSLALDHLVTYSSRVNNLRVDGAYDGRELTLHGESRLDATTRAWMAARVYPGARERKVELDTLESRSESASWGLSHPVRITYGDRIRVDDFVFGSRGSRIALDGTLDRRGMQRFRATVDSLPLGWIADIVGVGTLEGSVDGALDIAGPAAAPHVTGNLAGVIRSRNKAVGRVRGQADWVAPRGLHLDLSVYHPKGDSMRVAGELPLALSLAVGDSSGGVVRRIPRGELAMDVTAHQFPVDLLEPLLDPAVVNKLEGRLTVDAHARGDIESPALSGRIAFADAKIRIPPLGATYEKGTVDATLEGTTVRLTRARIESGDGRLEASGTIHVQGSPVAGFDLQSTLHDFQLADGEELRSTASGTLRLRGTATAPALAGAVRLRNTDYYLQAKSLEQGAEPVELTAADLRVVERRFGVAVDRPAGGQLSRWALDLDVELAGNNWLRRRTNPSIAVELAGKVEVRKARGESVRVFGAIQPLHGRSFVQLMGRRFDVRGGEVALQGPLDSAQITLHSEYRADSGSSAHATGVVITSEVAVDTGRLAVKLGSQPPMSTADIRSYLTTGRPAGTDPTLNSDQADVLTAGASLAVGAALGSVAGSAGQRLGLDVVQVLQDRQGGQTLVAGKYVSPPLYLGFRQPIVAGNDPNETRTAAETIELEVEYAALRRALLNLQGAGSEFRVFLRLRQ